MKRLAILLGLAACGGAEGEAADVPGTPVVDGGAVPAPPLEEPIPEDPWSVGPPLGARRFPNGDLEVRVRAPNATHIELCLFAKARDEKEVLRLPLEKKEDGAFRLRVEKAALEKAGIGATIFYGFRAFGPNWPFDPSFVPGSTIGFVSDVDADGNRMNPNKLLLDPYALEVSHDPSGGVFRANGDGRAIDSGPLAPKSIVVAPPVARPPSVPLRALRDDVVYEVHVRGFTKNDESIPEEERGTFKGAARRAKYLHDLGVRAIELLPLHETTNDQNDRSPESEGDNYWGYSTLSFFAPDRRYAFDKSPGGPTRELRAMIDAFHAEGIKVFVDVVYNHTAEGGGAIYGFRGLDNRTYYELAGDPKSYVSSNGVGPNFNTADPVVADLVLDSLRYWHEDLGVDGYRFDLASVVANGCTRGCYRYDRALPERIAKELPARGADGKGVDLIAEPWGLVAGSYQVGGFPKGWSEWNDRYRDTVRRGLNRLGVADVSPREIAQRVRGSADLYEKNERGPAASVNFVVAHDGMTLADLFTYDAKNNGQPWPFGPSNGGTDNDLAWSHGGDPARQRSAARTAFALLALSAGVPMMLGGDERLRTQRGNNNAYNLDSPGIWLDWKPEPHADAFATFVKRALAFRHAHASLRPDAFWNDVVWLETDGKPADGAYLDAPNQTFLAWRLEGKMLVAFNRGAQPVTMTLPSGTWSSVADTSIEAEAWGNWRTSAVPVNATTITVGRRTIVVLVTE